MEPFVKDNLREYAVEGIDSDEEPDDLINLKNEFEQDVRFVRIYQMWLIMMHVE
jgi:hypothetical protein